LGGGTLRWGVGVGGGGGGGGGGGCSRGCVSLGGGAGGVFCLRAREGCEGGGRWGGGGVEGGGVGWTSGGGVAFVLLCGCGVCGGAAWWRSTTGRLIRCAGAWGGVGGGFGTQRLRAGQHGEQQHITSIFQLNLSRRTALLEEKAQRKNSKPFTHSQKEGGGRY